MITAPIKYINKWDNRVMLTLSFPLGVSPRAPTAMTSVQGGGGNPAALQQSVNGTLGVDSAFGYGLNASYQGSSNTASSATTAGANASYRSPLTTINASLSHSNNYNQGSFGVSGGVVVYGGGMAFTPTMGDTVAVVEAKDAAGARVVSGSGLRVDPWGHAIVSSLTPFASNQIEIDPKGLPLNVAMKSTEQSVAPTAGAVVRLAFETEDKGRAAILHIRTADGKPAPFGAEVTDEQGQSIGTVGQAGRVIASGFKTDSGSLRVNWGEGASERCVVAYKLPPANPRSDAFGAVVDAVCQ
jgi:outer membrane usher protein